jgi:hypothetical protein
MPPDAGPQLASPRVADILRSLRNVYAHNAATTRKLALQSARDEVRRLQDALRNEVSSSDLQTTFGGAAAFPVSAIQFITDLAAGHVHERALDPWAGSGLLLSTLIEAGVARTGFGVVQSNWEYALSRGVSSDLDVDWAIADPLDWLDASRDHFDLVVSRFPVGMHKEKVSLQDSTGTKRIISDEFGRLALLESALKLTADGVGLFIVSRLDAHSPENSVYHALEHFGLHLDAYFALPEGPFEPLTSIPGGVAIIRRGESSGVFVGKVSGDPKRDAVLLSNYRAKEASREFGLGRMIPPREFFGWPSVEAEEKVRVRALRVGYPEFTVKEVASSVELSKEGPFAELPNAVYVPAIGRGRALSSQAELTMKPHNYVQLALDPRKASAPFVAEFLNSPLGIAVREEMQSGFIPRLTKKTIQNMRLYLPPIPRQTEILETQGLISNIKNDLATLESQLWAEPRKSDQISARIAQYTRQETFTEWLDRLPFPLASILWAYHTAGEDQKRRYEHLISFFEALAEFMAIILLSSLEGDAAILLSERDRITRALAAQHLTIERSTFGTWKSIYELLAKKFRAMTSTSEGRATVGRILCSDDDDVIAMLVSSEIVGVLQRCNAYRNSWVGHTGVVSDGEAANRHTVLQQELSTVREAFGSTWSRYQLILPIQSTFSAGIYKYRLQRVTGRSAPFEQFGAELAQPLEDGNLYFLGEDERVALRLIPLVRVMASPASAENACYFYSRQQPDGIRFVSYHFDREAEVVNQFPETTSALAMLSAVQSSELSEEGGNRAD